EALTGLLMSLGLAVAAFPSALDFLASPTIADISCLIADVHMPRMTGPELHGRLAELGHAIPTILFTAYPAETVRARALADRVVAYVAKAFNDAGLIGCIQSVLERKKPVEDHS